jgi:uncharacterized protein YqeY
MSLQARIQEDMKAAMRSGDKERLGTIRLIMAAVKQREVDERITLDDTQVLGVLEKMGKQRRESMAQFQAGGRADLVAKEAAELAIINAYMPAALSDAELDALINEAIAPPAPRRSRTWARSWGSSRPAPRAAPTWPRSAHASKRACPDSCPRLTASMAGRIPQAFIDDLIARADIVEIISARVPLKRAGREYKACCPFHDEKTPSFWVSPDKQFYHCFGCGVHGTALGFLMEYDRLPFPEAVEDLATRLGLTVPHEAAGTAARQPAEAHRHGAAGAAAADEAAPLYPLLAKSRSSTARNCSATLAPAATRRSAACARDDRALRHRLRQRFLERGAAPLRRQRT